MVGLRVEFVAGRYHATPWNHHVNEGLVEWPPSPWRLLRALVAGWFKLSEPEGESQMRDLIAGLANVDPVYQLPRFTEGHTRQYMPTDGKPTLVFDTFVLMPWDRALLRIGFPGASLDDEAMALLDRIARQVRYLGRAESWAEVRLDRDGPIHANLHPDPEGGSLSLQAAMSTGDYAVWRQKTVPQIPKASHRPPDDLWGALTIRTRDLQRARWSAPPGVRSIRYSPEPIPVRPRRSSVLRASLAVRVARYTVRPREGIRPLMTRALEVADAIHARLAKIGDGYAIPRLIGRDAEGLPLVNQQHAYILASCEALTGRDRARVTHVHVALPAMAAEGLALDEATVLKRLRSFRLRQRGSEMQPFELVLEALWNQDDLRNLTTRPPTLGRASRWRSVTPMILQRHPKRRPDGSIRRDGPEDQVGRALEQLGLPRPDAIVAWEPPGGWLRFRRSRPRRRRPALPFGLRGFGFELHFAQPVSGPIALGYAAHLGLGRFEPLGP
ncbi:MAG: type I-U CRISPR-associated protein Csb2 [Myxococcota bacterium]